MPAQIVPNYKELAKVLAEIREGRTVALTNGCFDLLHVGHIRLLRDAARQGDMLVVALNDDESVRRNKGNDRPVVPLEERMEVIASIEGVDFVTSFGEPTAHFMLDTVRPQVHVKGSDWVAENVPERDIVEAYGGRIAICGDPKTHSSTELARRAAAQSASAQSTGES